MSAVIVVSIHNNSLGKVISVNTLEDGYTAVKQLSAEKLGRELTDEEKDGIDINAEFHHEDDADNAWSYAVGVVDE